MNKKQVNLFSEGVEKSEENIKIIRDSRYHIQETRFEIPYTRAQIRDARYEMPDTRNQIRETIYEKPDPRNQIRDAICLNYCNRMKTKQSGTVKMSNKNKKSPLREFFTFSVCSAP